MSSPLSAPAWVLSAQRLPVAFAQVREDPLVERWAVERCARDRAPLDVVMIASGGCTAALLATVPMVRRLHLVDTNPAQLALTRMKLWLLVHRTPAERMAILGHAPMSADGRARELQTILAGLGLRGDCLGPLDEVAHRGPDHAGRYEVLFGALRERLAPMRDQVRDLLTRTDRPEQQRLVAPGTPLGDALDRAFARVMGLESPGPLLDAAASAGSPAAPFHRHFTERLRHILGIHPAASNPFLWQVLLGVYPPSCAAPWLEQATPARMPEVLCHQESMDETLAGLRGGCDLLLLSNILDWMKPADARRTMALAHDALRPGGRVMIRQLNSTLDITALDDGLEWMPAYSTVLNRVDRSFFYRDLHVGTRV